MSRYLQVEGQSNLARDSHSGCIVNINKQEIQIAREAKQKRLEKNREFEELKNEVGELRQLLNKLVEKL